MGLPQQLTGRSGVSIKKNLLVCINLVFIRRVVIAEMVEKREGEILNV